jgi:hypothetical protein
VGYGVYGDFQGELEFWWGYRWGDEVVMGDVLMIWCVQSEAARFEFDKEDGHDRLKVSTEISMFCV